MIIAPIVEGHGDVQALPVLLRLINPSVRVAPPVRFPKTRLVDNEHLTRAVSIARANIQSPESGAVLLVLDADEDCAATLGPQMLAVMQGPARGSRCFAAIAIREFESWIVGGHPEIDIAPCETAGNPKGRIRAHNNNQYRETIDQPRYAARIDVERLYARSPSFARLARFVNSTMADPE